MVVVMAALVSVMPVVVGGGCDSSSNSSIGKYDASGGCNSSSNSSIGKCDASGGWWWLVVV